MSESNLKERLEQELERLHQERELITYRDLVVRLDMVGAQKIHRLTALLEETMRADHEAGRPFRAASVVSRTSGNMPQRGFFQLLRELGVYNGSEEGADARAAHQQELERLWANALPGQENTRG